MWTLCVGFVAWDWGGMWEEHDERLGVWCVGVWKPGVTLSHSSWKQPCWSHKNLSKTNPLVSGAPEAGPDFTQGGREERETSANDCWSVCSRNCTLGEHFLWFLHCTGNCLCDGMVMFGSALRLNKEEKGSKA